MNKLIMQHNSVMCRICFRSENNITRLFSDSSVSKGILDKFYLCFQIVMNPEKDLPDGICNQCLKILENVNCFRIMCITIYERFADFRKSFTREMNASKCREDEKDELALHEDKFLEVKTETEGTLLDNNKQTSNFFKCQICDKVLKTMNSLSKHSISMHQNRKHAGTVTGNGIYRLYHCTTCTYSTPHSQTLINHMRRHNGERPFVCECGKSFTQRSSLSAHRKTHSISSNFTCFICGKQFKLDFALKSHLIVHNTGQFKCDICQKVLKYKRSLQTHINRHHNIHNYNCEDCGDTFVSSSELINHKVKHKVDKNMECHLCGYKTHTKKNLIIHLKRHTGNKEYKCNICKVCFFTLGDLHRHQRKHSSEKPYSCPTCTQRFSHSPSVNKHMKIVHGVDYKWGEVRKKTVERLKKFY